MVSNDGKDWYLRNYLNGTVCYCIDNENYNNSWQYIVPIEDFNFKAVSIQSNCNKSIV